MTTRFNPSSTSRARTQHDPLALVHSLSTVLFRIVGTLLRIFKLRDWIIIKLLLSLLYLVPACTWSSHLSFNEVPRSPKVTTLTTISAEADLRRPIIQVVKKWTLPHCHFSGAMVADLSLLGFNVHASWFTRGSGARVFGVWGDVVLTPS